MRYCIMVNYEFVILLRGKIITSTVKWGQFLSFMENEPIKTNDSIILSGAYFMIGSDETPTLFLLMLAAQVIESSFKNSVLFMAG